MLVSGGSALLFLPRLWLALSPAIFVVSDNLTGKPAAVGQGSQKTLLRHSIYKQLKNPPKLDKTTIRLSGSGNTSITPFGIFLTDISTDDSDFNSSICVVNDNCIAYDCIIGTDVIQQGTLVIANGEIKLHKHFDSFLINVANVIDNFEADLSHISDVQIRTETASLIANYRPQKSKSVDIEMEIVFHDTTPVYPQPRRLAPNEKAIVEQQISLSIWLTDGIICPSTSNYASPVVLVKKKDNSHRLCVDYRRLNKRILREHFPLPLISEVLDKVGSAKIFSTQDLRNVFHHVDVAKDSQKYTAFVTHERRYEFIKVPFGLSNSPAFFSRYINCVFRDLLNDGTLLYMDDLIICADNEYEGLTKLKQELKLASEYGLDINIK
ncbi:Retrovirus-related Pol polyprotein from transposon 412 [Araneus ventricosus]|uniref:Retrovirus-related Pol polyprotein from transposon 412 n=1 Tax=Araneus ventricosus TaxID=182803 RepID=A0A4Y2T733_ARAVE|nr:Retrovirus-related Pol polyprotein from transposon 412 [Araneus ventricosus]